MSFPFNAQLGLIRVEAELEGPSGNIRLSLALDTGATMTMVSKDILVGLGYAPDSSQSHVPVTMGSAVVNVPSLAVRRLRALGREWTSVPLLCHNLPPSAAIDGVLGLDLLRGSVLTIDFRGAFLNLS